MGNSSSSTRSSKLIEFNSNYDFTTYIRNSDNPTELIVIYFADSGSRVCQSIESIVENLAYEHLDVKFIRIDVKKLPDAANDFKVRTIPTFVLRKYGWEMARVVGAEIGQLQMKINEHKFSHVMLTQIQM